MAMIPIDRLKAMSPRAVALIEANFDFLRKAVSFALIGVVNALIDTGVFLAANSYLNDADIALRPLDAFAAWCGCSSPETLVLIVANTMSWVVAVSCSYVMNSYITFAAESGRRLRWKDYATFVVSGIVGAIANTTTLIVAAGLLPSLGGENERLLAAKGCAILAGFVVNFTMSHFVVFRTRPSAPGDVV